MDPYYQEVFGKGSWMKGKWVGKVIKRPVGKLLMGKVNMNVRIK